jgi:hypothetical protein
MPSLHHSITVHCNTVDAAIYIYTRSFAITDSTYCFVAMCNLHRLTLQNYASISEQQIGGFLQVGAHGTGARTPPADEQVIAMRLVTPNLGPLELSEVRCECAQTVLSHACCSSDAHCVL